MGVKAQTFCGHVRKGGWVDISCRRASARKKVYLQRNFKTCKSIKLDYFFKVGTAATNSAISDQLLVACNRASITLQRISQAKQLLMFLTPFDSAKLSSSVKYRVEDPDPVESGMFCPDPDPELSFRIRIRPIWKLIFKNISGFPWISPWRRRR